MRSTAFLTTLIMLIISNIAIAQRDPMRYGRIDRSDLELQYYEADSAASALIIGDYGNIKNCLEFD